ncbi:ATP-binding protein [Streptomyces sp. R02]|uniref:ATP-binding protein n=1 Tax=Streptomyces sp. R02 TaxID=3238623 RepID=A0AB39M0J0_9ACTN
MHAATESVTSPAGGAATRPLPRRTVRSLSPRPRVDDYNWFLTHSPQAARAARKITAAVLAEWRLGAKTTDAAVLVVSELVTNAGEHAQPPLKLHLYRELAGSSVRLASATVAPSAASALDLLL